MQGGRLSILFVLAVASLALLASGGAGNSAGAPEGAAKDGCTCHSMQASPLARVSLTGFPEKYSPGTTYDLIVSVSGPQSGVPPGVQNQGGFALRVDPMGGLLPADDKTMLKGQTITHTAAGNDQRSWKVRWTPPANSSGPATISFAGNAVNGDALPDPGDLWAKGSTTVPAAGANATASSSPTPSSAVASTSGLSAPAALLAGIVLIGLRRR